VFLTCSNCRISPLHDTNFWEASEKSISLPMKNVHEQVTEHNYLGLSDLLTLAAVFKTGCKFHTVHTEMNLGQVGDLSFYHPWRKGIY